LAVLALTDHAIAAIRELTGHRDVAEDGGVRIAADRTRGSLRVSLEPQPRDGDEVFDADDARLFMTSDVARLLDNRALDAHVGTDGGVRFALTRQTA
jgi:Fe-S cluster assembly iron-binding protein IscA